MRALIVTFLTLLGIVYTLLGFRFARKLSNVADFFLADRNLGLAATMFTLVATQLGGSMLLGTSEYAYKVGAAGIVYSLGVGLGFILLGCGIASRLRGLEVSTTAEIFEKYYDSTRLKKLASLISIATLMGILTGQVVASRNLLAGFGLDIPYFIAIFWAFVVAYIVLGGLRAVALIDSLQVVFILVILGGLGIYSFVTGPYTTSKLSMSSDAETMGLPAILGLLTTFIMPALFSVVEQDLAQKLFAARTRKIATMAAWGAAIFMALFALVPVYFGIAAKLAGISVAAGGNPAIMFLRTFTSNTFFALALCGLIAAITSTADSLICAISSNVTQDFLSARVQRGKYAVTLSRIITLLTGVTAMSLGYLVPRDIIRICIGSYELAVATLLVPICWILTKKKLPSWVAGWSITAGGISFLIIKLLAPGMPAGITALGIATIAQISGAMVLKVKHKQ